MPGSDRVAEPLLDALVERGETLALAESCTGGLASSLVTDVPGASEAFLGGIVAYTVEAKRDLLGVDASLLDEAGPVSEAVAAAMAETVRARSGADWTGAVTGLAGPAGGSEATPVGTVFVAVASEDGTEVERYRFEGDRGRVKRAAAEQVLADVRSRVGAQSPS